MAIGVDLVDLRRLDNPDRLAKKVLSKNELELYLSRDDKINFLGGRFAAKEAFLKALGQGLGQIPLQSIEVLYRGPNQAPYIFYQNVEYDVSISHDGDYAIAVVCI